MRSCQTDVDLLNQPGIKSNLSPLQRLVPVYLLLVAIMVTMLSYSLTLVLSEELMQNPAVQSFVFAYPFLVGIVLLGCILYVYMAPYVSEFKRSWMVAIAIGAPISISAFILPMFWYLHIWTPFLETRSAPTEDMP